MPSLTDYLSTWFISDEQIQTHKDVADAQQAILDRQYDEGKRGVIDYLSLSNEVQNAGTELEEYRDENDNILGVIPWWIWLALAGVAFWYLGGFIWIRNILAKR
jgi:hypothetical protein